MEFYLDTVDIEAIRRFSKMLPLAGVTTNPSIIAKNGQPVAEVLPLIRDALDNRGHIFAQVIANTTEAMVKEAETLVSYVDGLVVKIPVTEAGLGAIKILKSRNIVTLGTAVYNATQGFFAAQAGAQYIAPYVSRIDAQGGDGVAVVTELQYLLSRHTPEVNLLAASFKSPRQVLDCMLTGCSAVTLPITILEQMLCSPVVNEAIEVFGNDWYQAFHTRTLL